MPVVLACPSQCVTHSTDPHDHHTVCHHLHRRKARVRKQKVDRIHANLCKHKHIKSHGLQASAIITMLSRMATHQSLVEVDPAPCPLTARDSYSDVIWHGRSQHHHLPYLSARLRIFSLMMPLYRLLSASSVAAETHNGHHTHSRPLMDRIVTWNSSRERFSIIPWCDELGHHPPSPTITHHHPSSDHDPPSPVTQASSTYNNHFARCMVAEELRREANVNLLSCTNITP